MCILLCSQHFLQFERNHLYHSTVITYFLYVAILSYSKGRMTRNTALWLQRVKEKIIKEKQQGTSFVCNQTDGGICGFNPYYVPAKADSCRESSWIMCNLNGMCNICIVWCKLHIHIIVLTTPWDGMNHKSHQFQTVYIDNLHQW